MRATAVSTIKIGLISLILTILAAAPAAALSSVTLQWRGNGGDTRLADAGNALPNQIVDIVLTVDGGANTVIGVFWSVNYTNEVSFIAGPGNELASVNLPSMGNTMEPISAGIDDTGSVLQNFDQASLSTGLEAGNSVTLGSIKFSINEGNRQDDGLADVTVLIQQNGIDGISDSSGTRCAGVLARNDCPYTFGSLFVPEPTTSALVVLGLGMGVFYSRRR